MALRPDAIGLQFKSVQRKGLSREDVEFIDAVEARIDAALQTVDGSEPQHACAFVNPYAPQAIGEEVLDELARRYRAVGWAAPRIEPHAGFTRYVIHLEKNADASAHPPS